MPVSFIPQVGSLPVPAPATRQAAPQSDAKTQSNDAFADLLAARPATDPAAPSKPAAQPANDGKDAAAVDGTAPVKDDEDKQDDGKDVLDTLMALLDQLGAALQNNQPVDPELLQKLDAALSAFSAYTGIDLSAFDPSAASGDAKMIDPTSLLGQLTQKAGDLSKLLAGDTSDLAARLDVLNQKLNAGGLSAEALSKLGFALEPEPAPAPALATPELKLPDSTLTKAPETAAAKPAELPSEQKPAEPAVKLDKAAHAETPQKAPVEAKPADKHKAAPAEPAVAAADEADPNPPLPGTSAMARVEVVGGVRAVQAAYQAPPTQVNAPQLAFDIVRHVQAGNTKFHIRLDPPELGRIDVRMDVDKTGNVTTRLMVEKSETLDLLQRDQRSLERALAQAGLEGGKTNLEFSLRQNPSSYRQDQQGEDARPLFADSGAANDDAAETATVTQYRGTASAGGLNLFV